jgi:hypothetical protein
MWRRYVWQLQGRPADISVLRALPLRREVRLTQQCECAPSINLSSMRVIQKEVEE